MNEKGKTRKYEFCGIGNALVDLQVEVSDNEITELGLIKGTMILTDATRQKEMLEKIKGKSIKVSSGGSAANTVIAFSRLGGKGAYITSIGYDDYGRHYSDEFKKLGIALDAQVIEGKATGTCLVMITPDGERTMATCLGASAKLDKKKINNNLIVNSEWIYIEGYKLAEPGGYEFCLDICEFAAKNKTKISLTFSDTFITANFRNELSKIVQVSDLFLCNEAEAMSFSRINDISSTLLSLHGVLDFWAMTRGREGAYIWWKDRARMIPGHLVRVIDTTGAGDMFAGVFMYNFIKTGDPIKAGNLASFIAAQLVSQMGARLSEENWKIIFDRFKVPGNGKFSYEK